MDYEIKTAKEEFEPFKVVLKVNDLEDLKALLMLANMDPDDINLVNAAFGTNGYKIQTASALPSSLWEDLVAKCYDYGII